MTNLRKEAEMALSVLLDPKTTVNEVADAVKTIRQALAQPEKKSKLNWFPAPTKIEWGESMVCTTVEIDADHYFDVFSEECQKENVELMLGFTKREWVGLTDAEVEAWRGNYDFFDSALVREVEAKLKEKNS